MSDAFYDSFAADQIRRIVVQNRMLKRAVFESTKRQERVWMLLHAALHELAMSKGVEPTKFMAQWQREHAKPDTEGIPFG